MAIYVSIPPKLLQEGQHPYYYRYNEKELTREWYNYSITLPELSFYKDTFVLCLIDDIREAIVVSALFIREFKGVPTNAYYHIPSKILYLDMTEIIETSNYTLDDCINMLNNIYSNNNNVQTITKDRWGERLIQN